MEHARAVDVQRQHLRVFVFVCTFGLYVFPKRLRGRFGVVHHEGQFKNFCTRKTPSRVPGQSPDHIDYAVFGLVIKLYWGATQLHGRIAFKFDATPGLFFHFLHPGLVHGQIHRRLRGHEGVKLQGHALLGQTRQAGGTQSHGSAGLEQGTSLQHRDLLVKIRSDTEWPTG